MSESATALATDTAPAPIGFLGLGAIGLPMAVNIATHGFDLLGYDLADRSRWGQDPIQPAPSALDVARRAEIVLLSLPDASVVRKALADLIAVPQRRVRIVIDLSTIGVTAAHEFDATARQAGIHYVDAPVSGGVSGAQARKLAVMCACPKAIFAEVAPVLEAFSTRVFHVGEIPGQGQALKLANNFLSGLALVATSEAALFGLKNGIDLDVMMEVLKASSGRNSAVEDKFPNYINKGRFDAGFRNTLMSKDVGLFAREAEAAECLGEVGELVARAWKSFSEASPDQDTTLVFQYLRDGLKA